MVCVLVPVLLAAVMGCGVRPSGVSDAGSGLASSSPYGPGEYVLDVVADGIGDAVEEASGLVHGEGYQVLLREGIESLLIPFFASTRRTARKASAAMDRVMCRYHAVYPRTW